MTRRHRPPLAAEALAAARAYARDALAPEALRAYASDWAHFTAWSQAAGCAPLPGEPAAMAAYLAALALLHGCAAAPSPAHSWPRWSSPRFRENGT